MSKYTGFHCPICGGVFTDQDDVVVCPDCGAPHHRECWTQRGHCAYQDRHKENLEWHEDRLIQPGTAQQTAAVSIQMFHVLPSFSNQSGQRV